MNDINGICILTVWSIQRYRYKEEVGHSVSLVSIQEQGHGEYPVSRGEAGTIHASHPLLSMVVDVRSSKPGRSQHHVNYGTELSRLVKGSYLSSATWD